MMRKRADISVLIGMTDREIREAIAKGDGYGEKVLAAMLRERDGNVCTWVCGRTASVFSHVGTTQLNGEMLVCRREPVDHVLAIDPDRIQGGGWGGCLAHRPNDEILLMDASGQLCRSTDAGQTWSKPVRLVVPGPEWGVFGALGALRDGTLLISGMSKGLPVGVPESDQPGPPIEGLVCRSADGGKTWEEPFRLDQLGYHVLEPASHLRFLELRDGTILLGVSGNVKRTEHKFYYSDGTLAPPPGSLVRPGFRDHDQWVFRSQDGGRTWGEPKLVAEWGCESNFVELPSGKILSTIRYQREWAIEGDDPRVLKASYDPKDPALGHVFIDTFISESTDRGYTWSEPRKASRWMEHPSDIVCLSDGTVAMVMGHKTFPFGPQVIWSRDEGRTWSESFILLHMDPLGAAGQPSALVLEDDTILVSYDRYTWDTQSVETPPAKKYQLWVARFKLPSNS